MKPVLVAAFAIASLGAAKVAREVGREVRTEGTTEAPFAPSPGAAPFVSLGYRELAADLLFIRLKAYFGGEQNSGSAIADLAEAIAAADPMFYRIYEWGARAMTAASEGVDERIYLRAIRLLEAGAAQFPRDWALPLFAGQIYMVDLTTSDPARRRAWDERGAQLLESATRKPNAPASSSIVAANLRTKLGQQQQAIEGLREMLLVTQDVHARQRIIDKLATLEAKASSEIAHELLVARKRFLDTWKRERPMVPPTLFVLLGPPLPRTFDLGDLAVGGTDVVGSEVYEPLEPLE